MSLVARLAALQASQERGVLFTVVEGEGVGAKLLVLESGERVGSGVPDAAADQFPDLVRRGRNNLVDIGADSQQETALSILAEILAVRAGRSGGSLRAAKQRIHAEVD